jgi:ATP-dependent protease ClpP protease subunit
MDPVKVVVEVQSSDEKVTAVACDDPSDEVTIEEKLNGGQDGIKLSQISFIAGNVLNTYLYSGISVADTVRIDKDVQKVEQFTDIRKMRFYINSPGGSGVDGLGIAGMVKNMRARGWTVAAEANGIIASAAVPIFASCKPRIADEGTIFMVHEPALFKWPGRETASDIRSQNELMSLLRERYLTIMADNTSISKQDWMDMEGRTTWFDEKRARDIGLVDSE